MGARAVARVPGSCVEYADGSVKAENSDPPQADSWGALPLFVAACALAKLLAVPGVLLLLRVQEQLRPK